MLQLMSWVSLASPRSRSLADPLCCSFLDLRMTAMNAAARWPGHSEFCIAFSLSNKGIDRQQRASVAPSSFCWMSLAAPVDSHSSSAFWKLPT